MSMDSALGALLIEQVEVYNLSELVHAAVYDEDFDHYGVKGMKWYQHIFTKEGRAERRANKPRNKYNSIRDIDKNDFRTQKKYLKSVKRGYLLRKMQKFAKGEVVAAVLAGIAGIAWGGPSAVATFAANTMLNATINNKVKKNYQEKEAAKWMREEEEESRRWSDDTSDSFDHYGRKGMKWYQHIYGDSKSSSGKSKTSSDKPKTTKPMTIDRVRKRMMIATILGGPLASIGYGLYAAKKHPDAFSKGATKKSKAPKPEKEAAPKKHKSSTNSKPKPATTPLDKETIEKRMMYAQMLGGLPVSLAYGLYETKKHPEAFKHYGRKGMKWYQHIFGDKKTPGGSKESKRLSKKYQRVNDLPKGNNKVKEKYLRQVSNDRQWRIAKTVAKRAAATGLLAVVGAFGAANVVAAMGGAMMDANIMAAITSSLTAGAGYMYDRKHTAPYWKTGQEQDANMERRRLMSDEENLDDFKKKQRYRG